jgi:hypothetical protein
VIVSWHGTNGNYRYLDNYVSVGYDEISQAPSERRSGENHPVTAISENSQN